MLAAQAPIAGSSVSLTVTVKLQLAVWLDASVAVQVTVVVPLAKAVPLGSAEGRVAHGQLSVAVTAQYVTMVVRTAAAVTWMMSGEQTAMSFGSLPVTVTR